MIGRRFLHPTPGSTPLSIIMVHKSSAPCHRHLAWIFTSSHSLRSWSALLGHNLGALLPSSASGSTSPSTWNILTSPGLPSLAVWNTSLAYSQSLCLLLYFLPSGKAFIICATRYSLISLFHIFLTNFDSLAYKRRKRKHFPSANLMQSVICKYHYTICYRK